MTLTKLILQNWSQGQQVTAENHNITPKATISKCRQWAIYITLGKCRIYSSIIGPQIEIVKRKIPPSTIHPDGPSSSDNSQRNSLHDQNERENDAQTCMEALMEQEKKDPKMSSLTDTKLIVLFLPFLSHFKTNMLMHEVPREQWSTLLLPTLDHTSTELLYSIPKGQRKDFNQVTKALGATRYIPGLAPKS